MEPLTQTILFTLLGFLSGAVPYSVLIGRFAGRLDIRAVGDHNPGATNVLRALNWRWFAVAFLLDTLKAAVPVGLAWYGFGITGWGIVPIALAPIAGHAFSPFLKFQGGKAVAATFGTWIGLTAGVAPTLLGLTLAVIFFAIKNSGWAVILTLLAFGGFLWGYYIPQFPALAGAWLGILALMAWTHRADLRERPAFRASSLRWVARLLGRSTTGEGD